MPFSFQDRKIDAIIAEAEAVQWSLQEVPEPQHLDRRFLTFPAGWSSPYEPSLLECSPRITVAEAFGRS